MEHAERTFAEHVAQRLKALDTNAFAFERANGLPSDAIRSILRGEKKSGTTLNKAREICDALGLEFYIGPPRDTGTIHAVEIEGGDFAAIPRLKAELSAGDGTFDNHNSISELIAFRLDWLARLGVSPGNCCLVTVRGDSMRPNLHSGDLALIDTARTNMRNGHVYAFNDIDGQTRVKRLERPEGETLLLRSDNPEFSTEIRRGVDMNRISILGQVVWSGHTWK
ncbi:S24 family peptidase [Pararhodobacter sp.]|uniref:S24 family peptidase n=1 Tax=Pararhodobacter sp. TaxID=2127056 RepID=UPI002FDCECAA